MPYGTDRNAMDLDRLREAERIRPVMVWNEVPTGTINGVNATFTLVYTPRPQGSLMVFTDGNYIPPSSYTLTKNSILISSGIPGTSIRCTYSK